MGVAVKAAVTAPAAPPPPPPPPPPTTSLFTLSPAAVAAGYYTYPPAAALARASDATLASLPRFVIGRTSIGEIAWLRPVDVRGVDVQASVTLEHGRVAVDRSTPSLNAPALVTFFNMLPPDAASAAAFEARLRRATERAGGDGLRGRGGSGV